MNAPVAIKLEATQDVLFFEWSAAPEMMKNCKVVFLPSNPNTKGITYEFWDTYCMDY